ncbi:MAG: ASKHA domain-containing protein [Deferrisomatales bacterium]|nr:ASKHA domain-containing protein [Deferrisomatales bacterium]
MPSLVVKPSGRAIPVTQGGTVLEALRRAGIELESPCGGEGVCGKCRVRVEGPEGVPETPHRLLPAHEAREGWRLACRLVPEGDLTVHLPPDALLDARILEGERLCAGRLAPAARIVAAADAWHLEYEGEEAAELPGWQPGTAPKGVAVDIGTTTLVVSLLDLATGRELATASALNPQTAFGHDVLSRIQKGSTREGLGELATAVRGVLNRLIGETCREAGADAGEVVDAVLGANTTMLQLAGEFDPAPLGRIPFRVGITGGRSYPAARFGLDLHPAARVYVPPVAHAFVGSDISGGLLACRFFEREGPLLFVDIGTNGELALSAGGRWLVTSAAAGPAFEGMGISQGMRAAPGAVEAVHTEGGALEVRVIGDVPARGLCGSGLIDAVACLLRAGALEPSGRMLRPGEARGLLDPGFAERLVERDGRPAFRLAEGVFLTQADVRQLQLAKAAIRTAVDLLLAEAGTPPSDLREVVLAGAFGYHLRPESLEAIGLLPSGLSERVAFAGNTSRLGAALLLVDGGARSKLAARMAETRHLPLPESHTFQDAFVQNLSFPA